MKMDRAEWTGTGAALLFHVILIGALSMSLAHVASTPEPPAMEVEFVEDVGLTSAAPQSIAIPPPAAQAPEIGEAEPTEPVPAIRPTPAPSMTPAKPQPRIPAKPAPRASNLDDNFLKGISDDLAPRAGPAKPAAPTFSAMARVSIGQAILRQAKPCADNQPYIGEGANTLRMKINLKFSRSGRLSRPPTVLGIAGDPDLRAKYGDLLEDQVRRIFAACNQYRLPPELYDTPNGGWNDFTFIYQLG